MSYIMHSYSIRRISKLGNILIFTEMIVFKTFFFHFVYFLVRGSSDNIWEAFDHFYFMEMKGYCSCAIPACKGSFLTCSIDYQTTQCFRSILLFNLCLKRIKSSNISYMFFIVTLWFTLLHRYSEFQWPVSHDSCICLFKPCLLTVLRTW